MVWGSKSMRLDLRRFFSFVRGWTAGAGRIAVPVLVIAFGLQGASVFAGPGAASSVSLQGRTVTAFHTLKVKAHIEDAAIELSRVIFELAKQYSSATSMNMQVRMDLSGADAQSISSRGVVDFDRLVIDDLSQVRQCSSYQELLYNSYVWLPSWLQMRLDRLLKSGE